MALSYQNIAGIDFASPILDGLLIDCWIGQVHLIIGELAPPYSNDSPRKYYKFIFTEVLEIKSCIDSYFFYEKYKYSGIEIKHFIGESTDWQDIDWIEDQDGSSKIEVVDDGRDGVQRVIFRDLPPYGRTWRVRDTKCIRRFVLESDLQRIEFLYCGKIKIVGLSEEQFREEKSSQFHRFFLSD